jgi:hypothetical protein
MSKSEKEVGQQVQEKFDFYLVSLVFTLLALSIQSAKFGISNIADSFELLGWLLLLVSGVFGLWRIEYIPIARHYMGEKREKEREYLDCTKALMEGKTSIYIANQRREQPIDERLKNIETSQINLNLLIDRLQDKNTLKYKIHKYSFALGIGFILLSRAYVPAKAVICAIT